MSSAEPSPAAKSEPISTVCVLGASGLLGSALARALRSSGVGVVPFSRRKDGAGSDTAHWDPDKGEIDRESLEGADAVVNLVGKGLDSGRWTQARKAEFWSSRADATEFLAKRLAQLQRPPRVLVNASAIGFYGDRGDEAVHEENEPGMGFLSALCKAWEASTEPASEAGIRTVVLRFGVVLTPEGGALAKMLPVFRLGLGGKLGSGRQRMPWISLTDAVGVIRFAMMHEELSGPVNAVAPESVSNAQFTKALGRVLHRPTFMTVPALALRAALGEMAYETLLTGANVRPRKLEIAGYRFEYPRLDDALDAMLGK